MGKAIEKDRFRLEDAMKAEAITEAVSMFEKTPAQADEKPKERPKLRVTKGKTPELPKAEAIELPRKPRRREQLPDAGTLSVKCGIAHIKALDAIHRRTGIPKRDLAEEAIQFLNERYAD